MFRELFFNFSHVLRSEWSRGEEFAFVVVVLSLEIGWLKRSTHALSCSH